MASLDELRADLLRRLAKFLPMEESSAAATSSLSTTSPTAPVPQPATPEEAPAELVMELHAVPELSMLAPARCSTECQDRVSLFQELELELGYVDEVFKDSPLKDMVWDEEFADCVVTHIGGSSLFLEKIMGTHYELVVETDKPTPWEHGLGGVGLVFPLQPSQEGMLGEASKLCLTRSVQDKEGDEERPMPWPSFVCYWLITSSMKLRQTSQGITLKLLVEDMQTVLGCPLSRYPLPICSEGSRSCFQCSFTGCRKMVVRCLALVPSINPVVCPPWRQPDQATHKAMLPNIQSDARLLHAYDHFSQLHKNLLMRRMILIVFLLEAFSDMAQLPLKITWPPQGLCAGLSLWEASFSGPQRGQLCFWQFGSVRKNCVAGFSAQPTSASNWKFTFQLCWKHQACYCIQSIAKKHYMILPCMEKNCKQYVTYPAASATTTLALVTLLKRIGCVLWFSMIWDPGITECVMEVPYYPGRRLHCGNILLRLRHGRFVAWGQATFWRGGTVTPCIHTGLGWY